MDLKTDYIMRAQRITDLIGNTPIVEVKSLNTGCCRLFLKLECQNPGGSIKDRIGRSMIEAAEKAGSIGPGGTLVEATAGNTGLGLALVAAERGYRLILVIPDKMSQEKTLHLKALGAEIVITRSDVGKGHPEYYQDLAEEIARKTPGSFYVNQFNNPANAAAHEETTGPEIWEQMDQQLSAVVCGVGSGGTITGLSRFFAKASPDVEIVLADPEGSILTDYVQRGKFGMAGSWLVEGIGEDFIPPLADLSRVTKAYQISDQESFATARNLLQREAIFAGSSSGTLVAAALRYCAEQTSHKQVVTFVCDSGGKYLSKMYNDLWMADRGLLPSNKHGNLRDFIARDYARREVVSVRPADTLQSAFARMKLYDISQLPVIESGKIIGLIDESDILVAVLNQTDLFAREVRDFMSTNLRTVDPQAPLSELIEILNSGLVGIVANQDEFFGLITRVDLLSYLRLQYEFDKAETIRQ